MDLFIACLISGFIGIAVYRVIRFQKHEPDPAPTHTTLLAKPGVTLDLVHEDGRVAAKVILTNITHDGEQGTSVLFEDYFKHLARNQFPRRGFF